MALVACAVADWWGDLPRFSSSRLSAPLPSVSILSKISRIPRSVVTSVGDTTSYDRLRNSIDTTSACFFSMGAPTGAAFGSLGGVVLALAGRTSPSVDHSPAVATVVRRAWAPRSVWPGIWPSLLLLRIREREKRETPQ